MFNPAKRLTALQALEHDFLVPVRRKDMEVRSKQVVNTILYYDELANFSFGSTEICGGTLG